MASSPMGVPTHSLNTQDLISVPLEEGQVRFFLTNLSDFVDEYTLPAHKHIQILLHLTLTSPTCQPTPISLLNRLLALHGSAIAAALPNPATTSIPWDSHSKIETDAKRRMRRCGREGVWALVLDHHRITPRGWDLLGWLVKLWELDASAFIAQIPQSAQDLQLDNASLPFYTIVSALDTSVDMPKRIATLLVNATLGPLPPFHPPSLIYSFIQLFRTLSPSQLVPFITLPVPWYFTAHLITITLEDIAEVRAAKAEARKNKTNDDLQKGDYGPYPPPTISHLQSLTDTNPKSALLKRQLSALMIHNQNAPIQL